MFHNGLGTPPAFPDPADDIAAAAASTPASVLIVDDDSRNLLAVESILEDEDYSIVMARTGEEALRAVMEQDFAVIVLDVKMPDISGLELARLIKQRRSTQHIPIIFLTAHYREDEHAILGYDVGAVDYLTKPLHPAVLRSKVNVFVDLFRKTRALSSLNDTMKAEIAERRTAEERFRVVVEAAPSAIVVFDDAGAIQLVNSQAELIFCTSREHLLRQRVQDLIPPEGIPYAAGMYHQQARNLDGVEFPVEINCRPIQSREGRLFLASILDITERKRTNDALRAKAEADAANEAKDRFLAVLSHELRTPLSPIVYAVALLENAPDCPPHIKDAIMTIQRNVRLETRLIDDLLDLARIRSGKLTLQMQTVELHEVLREALKICEENANHHNVRLAESLEAQNTRLRGDPVRLRQIFWNLLANGVKFTPEGGVVTLRTTNTADTNLLLVEVTDTGIGIEPEKLDSIFDAFEQVTRNSAAGLGLGLSICKALVEMHGGKIEARSEGNGRGTTLQVALPYEKITPAPEQAQAPDGRKVPSLRILVVEDHPDTAESLRLLLSMEGHDVRTAGSVAQALEAAESYEFDVLLSDIGLPDAPGTELIRQLKERIHRPFRAIAMTGFGMEDDLKQSKQAGFSEHLTKPVEYTTLRQTLMRVVEQMK